MKNAETAVAPACPHCSTTFAPRRKDQKYCSRPCAKAATRNTARGPREYENARRNEHHYSRAAWLSYDLNRVPPMKQRAMLLAILEAASGGDGALRTILFDPRLLGADPFSPIGKLFPDTRCPDALNVAKMVNAFCKMEWGCGVRDMILDNGKPAGRRFVEDGAAAIVPPHIYERTPEDAPCRPEGWNFAEALRPICKGFLWLTVSKSKTRELRALGGCNRPSAHI